MEIHEQVKGAVRLLRPRGALVNPDAELLKARALDAIHAHLGRVVLDAAAVPFADSRGLEILLELGEALAQSGQALKLCAVSETLREALELTDLVSLFDLYDDADSAVRSFL